MNITICASVDFTPQIIEIKKQLEGMGHTTNIPLFTTKIMNGDLTFEEFMNTKKQSGGDTIFRESVSISTLKRYWDFIKDSDAILVLNLEKNGIKNYIGGNTLIEMGFAYGHEKKIFLYNTIPSKSERIHYVDEIMDMKPIVINGDLDQIK